MKSLKFKQLKLKQISDSIAQKTLISIEKLPERLKDIRKSLGLTQKQLARRLNVSRQEITKIEKNKNSSSLKTLAKIASALNCELKCAIVSDISIEKMIKNQAHKKAEHILKRTNANMALENQAVDKKAIEFQKQQLINEFITNPNSSLWED